MGGWNQLLSLSRHDGAVGIGITGGFAGSKLAVNGDASITGELRVAGNLGVNGAQPSSFHANATNLVVGSTSTATNGITIASNSANYGVIYFADGTSSSAPYVGNINYNHADDSLRLGVAGSTTNFLIDSTYSSWCSPIGVS